MAGQKLVTNAGITVHEFFWGSHIAPLIPKINGFQSVESPQVGCKKNTKITIPINFALVHMHCMSSI